MPFSPELEPARYAPFEKGVYEVAPGLRPFGTDFGNGRLDNCVFQLDRETPGYLANKEECRREDIAKYFHVHDFAGELERETVRFLATRMAAEWPAVFSFEPDADHWIFASRLSGDRFTLDRHLRLATESRFRGAFDALVSQVPEDITVMTLTESGNELRAIHLCAAGHWSPAAKIGRDFFEIHRPVAHIDKINDRAQQFAEVMVHKGPYVRFAWGFATDTRLNHHPEPPPGIARSEWHGRSFTNSPNDRLYVRIERQVTWGLPAVRSAIFTIRVSYRDGADIKRDPPLRNALVQALLSMSPEALAYKGLTHSIGPVLDYLGS